MMAAARAPCCSQALLPFRSPMQLRPPGRTASFAARTCAFAGVVDKQKGLRAQIE
jgi:hypothetical protein